MQIVLQRSVLGLSSLLSSGFGVGKISAKLTEIFIDGKKHFCC